mmetsp:Transcript_13701/g.20868  ORF Transcript_13701/g.20868 Transcript_13701/m.20868 type:complete len:222 (-) Transcript_13701:43-708(-)
MMINTAVTPNDGDILCGRGHNCYNHKGNQNFRVVIAMHLPKYAHPKTSRKEKTLIVQSIVDEISSGQRRFLREGVVGWYVLNKEEGKKKVGHALRDALSEMKRTLKPKGNADLKEKNFCSKSPQLVTVPLKHLSVLPSHEKAGSDDNNSGIDFPDCCSVSSFSDCHSMCSENDVDFPDCLDIPEALIEASLSKNLPVVPDPSFLNELMSGVDDSTILELFD